MKQRLQKPIKGPDIASPDFSRMRRYHTAVLFYIIGALLFLFFIIDDLFYLTMPDFIIDVAVFIFCSIMPFALKKTKYHYIWYTLSILLLLSVIIHLVFTDPEAQRAILLWFLLFPPVSFLLLGNFKGLFPVLTALTALLVIVFPQVQVHFPNPLEPRFIFHILTGFCTLSVLTWIYEFDRRILEARLKDSWHKIHKQTQELSQANEKLSTLIHETNHRIHNNLAMIIAFIHLFEDNGETKEQALAELKEKIGSIAVTNRMLYLGGNASEVEMSGYIEDLIEHVSDTFAAMQPKISIETDPLVLHPETANKIGLVINESITNACKYGIQPGGKIGVSLKAEEQYLVLTVDNDGSPFPDSLDIHTTQSMGFSIIRSIAKSLDAQITLRNQPKPAVELRFPAEHPDTATS